MARTGDMTPGRQLALAWADETADLEFDDALVRLAEVIDEALRRARNELPVRVKRANTDIPVDQLAMMRCLIPLCGGTVRRRGMCKAHYNEWLKSCAPGDRERIPQHLAKVKPPPGSPLPMATGLRRGDVDEHRRTSCPAYDRCLAWCAARGWPGFSCQACKGPALDAGGEVA
jgi:hypothetical protein